MWISIVISEMGFVLLKRHQSSPEQRIFMSISERNGKYSLKLLLLKGAWWPTYRGLDSSPITKGITLGITFEIVTMPITAHYTYKLQWRHQITLLLKLHQKLHLNSQYGVWIPIVINHCFTEISTSMTTKTPHPVKQA